MYMYIYTLGTMSLVALENGRNVIAVVENEDDHSAIFQKLQAKYVTEWWYLLIKPTCSKLYNNYV